MDYHDFPSKTFCVTGPEHFVEKSFCVSEKVWYRKLLEIREGASRFSVKNVLSHSTEFNRKRTFPGFGNTLVSTQYPKSL